MLLEDHLQPIFMSAVMLWHTKASYEIFMQSTWS